MVVVVVCSLTGNKLLDSGGWAVIGFGGKSHQLTNPSWNVRIICDMVLY